ncbi:MAG TPA: AI-2E family transporter [Steroidobacteraceae bacterium]|nr:AI-2E family transporter [Steroidobacteraceae bacterium]
MQKNPILGKTTGAWAPLLVLVLTVGILWAGQTVLMPLALGVILAFLLSPLVRLFDRMRLPRVASVVLTLLLTLGTVGGAGYVAFEQFADLSSQVTRYTSSMRHKVAQLRAGSNGGLKQFTRTVDRVTEQLDENLSEYRRAQPVRVMPPRLTPVDRLKQGAATVFEPLASAVIVLALVAFMLSQREDLRDRLIRLMGPESVTMTTRLLNEAAHRVSQYLVAQLLVNLVFGTFIAAGLYWIGVPYAALWAGLTVVLRFVPFVGTTLAALLPAALAFATFPGWAEALQTLALFAGLDLVTAYFAEPIVFGQRTGVSSFALLISALFWIWVWGPVGLLLSTPLTVCIAVLGRHVRSLRFLAVIFADEPALAPHVRFYQRLLARDEDEAATVVERSREELGPIGIVDHILVPALALVLQHRSENEVSDEDAHFMLDVIAETSQSLAMPNDGTPRDLPAVIGLAARNSADQLVLEMMQVVIGANTMQVIPGDLTAEQALRQTLECKPAVVCIAAISPTRGSEIRNFCRRIRAARRDAKILVLRAHVDEADLPRTIQRLKDAGASAVVTTTKDAVAWLDELQPEPLRAPEDSDLGAPEGSSNSSLAALR